MSNIINTYLKIQKCTFSEYQNSLKEFNTIYFITDTLQIFIGDKEYMKTETVKQFQDLLENSLLPEFQNKVYEYIEDQLKNITIDGTENDFIYAGSFENVNEILSYNFENNKMYLLNCKSDSEKGLIGNRYIAHYVYDSAIFDDYVLKLIPAIPNGIKIMMNFKTGDCITQYDTDQTYMPDSIKAQSGKAVAEAIAKIITEETDPTVPEWAKQPEKPTYTAEEIGTLTAEQIESAINQIKLTPGPKGDTGEQGPRGEQGLAGDNGQDGLTPTINEEGNWQIGDIDTGVKAVGSDGKSAYEIAKENGFEGAETEWLESLKGIIDLNYNPESENAQSGKAVAEAIAKINVQLTPEFVDDISKCTDTSKIYVLPDGYIYAYMKNTIKTEEAFGTTDWSTFSPVSITGSQYVFNHIGAPSIGNLKSISMKCDAVATIVFAVAHMSNGVVTSVDNIQVNTKAGENTYVNGVDFYYDGTIQEGDLIGYSMQTSCKIYYGTSANEWCYKTASLTDYTLTAKTYGFAISAVVESSEETYSWANTGVSFSSGDHDSRIEALENDVAELKKGTPKADVATIGTEIEPVIDNYADSEAFVIKVKASETSGTLTMEKSEDVNTSAVRQICYVDFANNKIGFYNKSADGAALTIHREKTLGFSVVAGHEYVVEMIKRDSKYAILKVTDTYSLDSDEISCSEFEVGRGWGSRKYTYTGDSDDILSVKSYILQNKKTKLLIVGDSYIEGSSLPEFGEDRDNRYAMRLKNALNGDCFINGRGGAASANILGWFNTYLPEVCQPEYTIVSCGGNDGNYDNWVARYNAIIAKIEEMGSKPILTTVAAIGVGPCKDIFGQMNEWIRNRGYDYIDVNLVTSLNYEGTELNPEYVVSDNVHPNSVGHEIIFKRALLDVPYIFRNDNSIVDGNEVAY